MKKLIFSLLVPGMLLLVNCGEEGLGFNIGKEISASIPVELPFSSIPYIPAELAPFWQNLNFNPDGYTESTEYDLSEMVSSDDLDFLDEVIINSISYEITGLSAEEEVNLDEIRITYTNLSSNQSLGTITLLNRLQNTPKTAAALNYDLISQALEQKSTIRAEFFIDFAELPSGSDINFDFNFYFDVTAKIRQ